MRCSRGAFFFDGRPALGEPLPDRGLVALPRASRGLLGTPAPAPEQPADVPRMIPHTQIALDQAGHARARPHLAAEAVRLGAPAQAREDARFLRRREAVRTAWRRTLAQRRRPAALARAPHPLRDRARGDAQGRGDVALEPALREQFSRPQPPPFPPVDGARRRYLLHQPAQQTPGMAFSKSHAGQ